MIYFHCSDCKKSFSVMNKKQRKKYFCPYCGENVAIGRIEKVDKDKSYCPWSQSEETLLIELSKTKFLYEIADNMGRTENSVRRKLAELRKAGLVTHSRRTIKKYV